MKGKIDARYAIAFGAGAALGGLCGYLLAHRAVSKAAEARIETETSAARQHYALRLAEANAANKGDHPGDGAATVGDGVPESWLKDKLAPVVEEELEGGGLRAGTRPSFPYGAAGKAVRAGTPPPQRSGEVVARRNTLDDAEADGRLHDADDSLPASGDVVGVPDQAGPDSPGRRDPLEGMPRDPADRDQEDDHEAGARGIGPLLAPDSKPLERIVLLSKAEFLAQEDEEFTQVELTYFAGDGVLVDEREVPIRSPEMIAGKFAQHFGHEPDDPDIVYVRNKVMKLDIEIKRRETEYRTEVLGYGVPE